MGLLSLSSWPARYAGRASQIRREEGLWRLSKRILRRLSSPLVDVGSVTFFERRLDTGVVDPVDSSVREVARAEIGAIADGIDPEQTPEAISARFARGDRCFASLDATGKGEHTRWVTTSPTPIPEIGRDVVLSPGQAYFYNGYTRPDRRGHGADGRVRTAIFATLHRAGFTRAVSYVRGDNAAGLRAASRWQQPIATVRYLRLWRWRPILFGARQSGIPVLVVPDRAAGDAVVRERAWRRWFQGWTGQPLATRSTGCYSVRDSDCRAAAESIVSLLGIDPSDRVLDVGCDSALVSRFVAPRCRRFTGVDFIPDMLRHGRDQVMAGTAARTADFVAADGRALPIRTGAFPKVYCSAVLHTLATHADGHAMIEEMIRVTADGGIVLLASVPDRAKRRANRALVWRRASAAGRLTLPLRWITPAFARRWARTVLRRPESGPPAFLDYDLLAIARALEARGMRCALHDFPPDHPNVDFRSTRSNLVITVRR
jgi:ubiquinone/menaquinone biosynthesis C-methylase UbiE